MSISRTFRCAFILSLILCGTAQVGTTKEISPAEDYCREINDPSSGLEVVLKPGLYKGACKVRRGGKPGSPLVIRGLVLTHRPRIDYQGKNGNVLEIYADNVVIQGLELGPTGPDVDGIRIFSGDYLTVEDCAFNQIGGIAVVANHASVRSVVVRRNRIIDSASTAVYFGCHNGLSCTISELLLERNFISGVSARESEIGYGIQVKLNSAGVIRDNVIVNTKGPGIMVYGASDLEKINIVERNFVEKARHSPGIVLGGGPAIVRNNVVVGNHEGGIALEDYGRRGLLRKIIVTHNTIYNNGRGGILIPAEGPSEAEISRNAIGGREGTPLFVGERKNLRIVENQDCGNSSCFVDPENMDFTPLKGSPLFESSQSFDKRRSPADDYFGRLRGFYPVVGAIESPGGPITFEIKP
jgi:Right handed beta helix region